MTPRQLLDKIPPEWRDVPLAVVDGLTVYRVKSIELIETPDGRMCVILHGRLQDGANDIAVKVESQEPVLVPKVVKKPNNRAD